MSQDQNQQTAAAEAPKIIPPGVGRKLWYRPGPSVVPGMCVNSGNQPLDCTVLYVWNDRCINAEVIDHAGKHHFKSSLRLVQPGDAPWQGEYAEWMPFQVGQAAKS
jgi:hypothetical protein